MNIPRSVTTKVLVAGIASVFWACGGSNGETDAETESAQPAVMIASPANNETFEGNFTVQLETRAVEIKPAGTNEPGTGHHHLFINRDITPAGIPIPTGDGVVHLGMAQTEYVFENLQPGDYMIIAVLGDYVHVRLPGVATDTVHVTIAGT